jgi:hypothetical protein
MEEGAQFNKFGRLEMKWKSVKNATPALCGGCMKQVTDYIAWVVVIPAASQFGKEEVACVFVKADGTMIHGLNIKHDIAMCHSCIKTKLENPEDEKVPKTEHGEGEQNDKRNSLCIIS